MALHKLSEKEAREAIAKYREYYTTIGIFEYTVYQGISGLLKELVANGKKLYVATSKPTPFAEKILANEQLDQLFSGIYGSFLDGRRTAKADVMEAVLKTHSLNVAETVMVGDRREDIIGAKSHQMHSIGVLYGYGSLAEMKEVHADQLAVDVSDLRQKLLGIQDHE
jgi:phosphoglycolate phosphatase